MSENVDIPKSQGTEVFELPETVDSILGTIAKILNYPYVQTIYMDANSREVRVSWRKSATEVMELHPTDTNPASLLSSIELEEHDVQLQDGLRSPFTDFSAALFMLHLRNRYPVGVMVESTAYLKHVMGIHAMISFPRDVDDNPLFMGLPVISTNLVGGSAIVILYAKSPVKGIANSVGGVRVVTLL